MKRKEAYTILIATFVLVMLWIIFSILHSATDSTISTIINTQIAQINPSFNTKIIDELKTRQQIKPINGEIVTTPTASSAAKIILTPTPTQTIAPITEINQTNATNTAILTP